jgi:hypothetical protein
LGDKATRELPKGLGAFDSSYAAWDRRIQSGQVGSAMNTSANQIGRKRLLTEYADWTDRIKAGELPPVPPRPQGRERNVVITQWDWSGQKDYFHDEITADRWNPTANPNGLVYGVHEESTDLLTILDPVKNSFKEVPIPSGPGTPQAEPPEVVQPSPYWGTEAISTAHAAAHSLMMDPQGRIWTASQTREHDNPAFCKQGSSLPAAIAYPINTGSRQVNMYDPKTGKWTLVNMCASGLHLNFANDANHTLWIGNPGVDAVGWLNTKMFDETHDAQKSQGWTPLILDTNGNGRGMITPNPASPAIPPRTLGSRLDFTALSRAPRMDQFGEPCSDSPAALSA